MIKLNFYPMAMKLILLLLPSNKSDEVFIRAGRYNRDTGISRYLFL